jgi:hypothetical protein
MAKEIRIAPNSVKNLVKKKLKLKNLKEGRGQHLTETNKLNRHAKAAKMLDRITKRKDKLENIVS